jgi:ferrous iron transport protein A
MTDNARPPLLDLTHLAPGEQATIVAIQADEALHQRLQALGFRAGKQIQLIRKASFSGPLQVRIGTTDVLIRRIEATKISIHKS